MRKAIGLNVAALVIVMVLTSGTALAGNGIPTSGPHWNINIIGHPKDKGIGGEDGRADDSSGHSIMIPLKNVNGSESGFVCKADGVNFDDLEAPTYVTSEPTGAKIYFVPWDYFEIIDRDATDGSATIRVPVVGDFMRFDIYIRVLGKPSQCMNINAYAYDAADSTVPHPDLWFLAGRVEVRRAKGKSTFVSANGLFNVWFCQMNTVTNTCTETRVLSVFNDVFESYFWSILNNGTRLVQLRLYPVQ